MENNASNADQGFVVMHVFLCLTLSVAPNDALDEGGSPISIEGINFGLSNSSVKCVFAGADTVDAVFISVTITVRPDSKLHIEHFHSKVACADNPFTQGIIEPSIPCFLGMLIENRGCGNARKLQIASFKPEIVENEKGLLQTSASSVHA